MARLDLYIDTYSRSLVVGPNNPANFTFPAIFQGDTISLRIYLLERTPTYPLTTPYTIATNTDLSLKVGIGPKNGTGGSSLYTQQFTWSKDGQNQYFYADLPLNTSGINTLIGAAESASAWFEVEYTQNGYPTTVFQQQVTLHAEVIETGTIEVPPGETALSVEVANNLFVKTENEGFILRNPNTNARAFVYLGDDGALHCDPIA